MKIKNRFILVLLKTLKILLATVLGLILISFISFYFFIFRTQNTVDTFYESIQVGDPIAKIIASDSDYAKLASEGIRMHISYSQSGTEAQSQLCAKSSVESPDPSLLCDTMCITIMRSFPYRGTICLVYDKNLKIIEKKAPYFWD